MENSFSAIFEKGYRLRHSVSSVILSALFETNRSMSKKLLWVIHKSKTGNHPAFWREQAPLLADYLVDIGIMIAAIVHDAMRFEEPGRNIKAETRNILEDSIQATVRNNEEFRPYLVEALGLVVVALEARETK